MDKPRRSGIHRAVELLDGTWFCAADPENQGRSERWFASVREEAYPAPVPGTIQQVFPGYHGVAWYWCEVIPPRNPHPDGRYLLRFGAVDYRGELWVNGERISTHDGGESPFVFDVTDSIRPGERNLLSLRVVNPTESEVDGLVLSQLPHRNKAVAPGPGSSINYGGIIGSVELLCRPAIYVAELIARPHPDTGVVNILALVLNTLHASVAAKLRFSVAPAVGGDTLQAGNADRTLQPGQTLFETQLPMADFRRWSPDDPFLYRLTVRLLPESGGRGDEISTRFAYRDFRFVDSHFRLNGRRILWKCVRTLNIYPVGQAVPLDRAVLRRELLALKSLGFNAVRFMAGMARTEQLELCDELGLLVYEETQAAWNMEPSSGMPDSFDRSLREMILRDRNHASVVCWGLLTDARDDAVFQHAIEALPMASFLDDSRLVFLNSGRGDGREEVGSLCSIGCTDWESALPGPSHDHHSAGDLHLLPNLPLDRAERDQLKTLGASADAPVFVSDCRVRGPVDLFRLHRLYAQAARSEAEDARTYTAALQLFFRDWEAWKMGAVFGRPEDFFRGASLQNGRRIVQCLAALRSNPHAVGLTVGLSDDPGLGVGVLNLFREPRPELQADLPEALAPLRWCLFAEPDYVRPGGQVHLEVVLANEDVLPPGMYPALFQVIGPDATIAFEQRAVVEITPGEMPLALPVFASEITLAGAPGRYRFTATFEDGVAAAADQIALTVAPPPLASATRPVALWAEDAALAAFLTAQGIPFTVTGAADPPREGEVILVVSRPKWASPKQSFDQLLARAEAGATVVLLTPHFFGASSDGGWLPAGELATIFELRIAGDPAEAWVANHPVFHQIAPTGLLEDNVARDLLPLAAYIDVDPAAQILCAAHLCRMHPDEYRSGVLLSLHPHGAGQVVLNSLLILENLGRSPAADQLLLNLLQLERDTSSL